MLAEIFVAALNALSAAAVAPEAYSFRGRVGRDERVVEFKPRGVRPSAVIAARLELGATTRPVSKAAVQAGLASARLRIRLRGQAGHMTRRTRPRLVIQTKPFAEFDGYSVRGGLLRRSAEQGLGGRHSIKADVDGSVEPSFARVWRSTSWDEGTDVWYGMALFVPDTSAWCYWNPVRWDNYSTFGSDGDVGGLKIEAGAVSVIRARYGNAEQTLTTPVRVPESDWFWVEVHQRFSEQDDTALSELFIDGRRVARATAANTYGRAIDQIRFGVVNVATSCSSPGTVYFDRARISSSQSLQAIPRD